jgi:hypothetical protein
MHKRFRVILLATIAAAFAVPLGFALSLESSADTRPPLADTPGVGEAIVAMTSSSAPLWRSSGDTSSSGHASWAPLVLDGPGLFLIGGAMFGLATVLKKAV